MTAGCRAPTAAPLARIDAGACHMPWGVEGRGWVRVQTQESSRATVSQAAHEQRDRTAERTTGVRALWCVLGAPGPAESTACHVRSTPICVSYVGVAWSTRSAMAHHDSEVMRSFCPWHAPARPSFQEPAPILKPSRIERNRCTRPALRCHLSPSCTNLHIRPPSQLHSRRTATSSPSSAKAATPRRPPT